MRRIRKVKDWNAFYPEGAVVDLGAAVQVHHHRARPESPLGIRQLAGSHLAIMNDDAVLTHFLHHRPREQEWLVCSERHVLAFEPYARASLHVVKLAGAAHHVERTVIGFN